MDAGTLFSLMSPTLLMVSTSGASELLVIYTLARRPLGHMVGTTVSTIVGGKLQLLAWKCYVNDQDVQAMSENEYDLFSWVTELSPQYSFAGYLGLSSGDASQIVPSTYRP